VHKLYNAKNDHFLTTPSQWRRDGGVRGYNCPRAPAEGGRRARRRSKFLGVIMLKCYN